MKTKRLVYFILCIALLIIEVCIALFVRDGFVRPYLGDVLVTLLICAFCRMFIPQGVSLLPVYVFLFAVVVEVAQYFQVVKLLGLESSRFFTTLLGTTFSMYDLICYAAGCIAAFAISIAVDRVCNKMN